ncbi:MAG TPA: hypothetical protein VFD50_01490 [Thermoleophilia bacterium]|nr:hypothetical protein [Thermoleophilia bacterium]
MQAKARVSQTNLTITVAAEVLRKARIRALQDDTSVNGGARRVVGDRLGRDPGLSRQPDRLFVNVDFQ